MRESLRCAREIHCVVWRLPPRSVTVSFKEVPIAMSRRLSFLNELVFSRFTLWFLCLVSVRGFFRRGR